jgi:D-tagatose-1,6-bisphosphate aldolase subunit GatZ/KbaZ
MDGYDVFAGILRNHEKRQSEQRGREKKAIGVYSVCSANAFVLEAAMDQAAEEGGPVLIEATSNQVNQQGGYTGMTPKDFVRFVSGIAASRGFPMERVILGGDHLGPLPWQDRPEAEAMRLGEELVSAYVAAGFTKIHLDTSMSLAGDPPFPDDETIAERSARLCAASEKSFLHLHLHLLRSSTGAPSLSPPISPPIYVIGSEVPTSGGAREEDRGEESAEISHISPTSPSAFLASYAAFRRAFEARELSRAFERVVAFVVEPGIAFTGDRVFDYNRNAAAPLCAALSQVGRPLVFEGHSTDYQTPEALTALVEDGVAILKVGPALTFALREGIFALEAIEREMERERTADDDLFPVHSARSAHSKFSPSRFAETLEAAMLRDDRHWRNHYRRDEGPEKLHFQMRYSLFDRARYYLPLPEVESSLRTLLQNLERKHFPDALAPRNLLKDCVRHCLRGYSAATRPCGWGSAGLE